MAYAFDGRGFGQILDLAEGVLRGAIEHERRLAALVAVGEEGGRTARAAADLLVPVPAAAQVLDITPQTEDLASSRSLFAPFQELWMAARAQRELAERFLACLLGIGSSTNEERTRVLVVDDSQDNRNLAADVLEAAGFQAITAANGLDAIIVAHYAKPAVVLMDLAMPVLNGVEAARLLKASSVTRRLTLVAFTAQPEIQGGLHTMFVDVLPKPATPEAIVATVRRFATTAS
jgi:CheY-like chemotaxis protein